MDSELLVYETGSMHDLCFRYFRQQKMRKIHDAHVIFCYDRTMNTPQGLTFAAGMAIGIAIGVAMHNIGVGVALGIAFGAAFESANKRGKGGS
jgi:hypothetical protein